MRNCFCIFAILFFIFPAFAHAALININTADATLFDTLPGIGLSYAADIIDYRTQNGPFTSIEGLKNVPNIGSGSRYANIASLITVGDTSVVNNSDTSDTSNNTASSTQDTSASSEDAAMDYIPPPSTITLDAGANQDAIMGVLLHFSARATTKGGAVDSSAKILWGFGDGSSAEGSSVEKMYRYAGKYLVVVTATDGQATGRDEFIVAVLPAQVRILGISGTGIMVENDSGGRLDLSGWTLLADTEYFSIPSGTVILPKASVLFPSDITKFLTTIDVALAYPGGVIAARYAVSQEPVVATTTSSAPAFDKQPSSMATSYKQVQTVRLDEAPARQVEPIISTNANIQAHEEEVNAPVAATELAATGAVFPSHQDSVPAENTSAAGIFKSPWTLGFLGTVILAGAAFILI